MKQRGFTLIEMIVTIVVVAVIGLAIAGFVEYGMKGYVESIDRQKVQVKGQFVVEKMSREISHAVPNSFTEVQTFLPTLAFDRKCLSFYSIKYSGFYHFDEPGNQLDFIVGQDAPSLSVGDYLIINPSSFNDLAVESNKRIDVSGAVQNTNSFSVTALSLVSESIAKRHYIYEKNNHVSFCIVNNTIEGQGVIERNGVRVTDSVNYTKSNFRYEEPSLQRGGVIHIELVLEQNNEISVYQQDVQVLNAP
ncbi:prepilin-type N-terminal cleavage/methylation domain-containing protein [Vibrio sp. 1F255]|uniref:prepilin-type N-terminal cleavage/methylation domain-containing protein n=1 Tax=Vibrio sp. 1F255 TaxID=3230009 RepID=UPI00352F4E54